MPGSRVHGQCRQQDVHRIKNRRAEGTGEREARAGKEVGREAAALKRRQVLFGWAAYLTALKFIRLFARVAKHRS